MFIVIVVAFKLPTAVHPDNAKKFLEDLRKYKEEYKKWIPFVNSIGCFAEFQTGSQRHFTN